MNKERFSGIDLLKILAIAGVVMHHILLSDPDLLHAYPLSVRYSVLWLFNTVAYAVVDVFVMATGFLYAKAEWRLSRLAGLWLSALFYSVTIPLLLPVFGFSVSRNALLHGFFPVLTVRYWFLTAYAGLFLLIPFLNMITKNRNAHLLLTSVLFLLLSVLPTVSGRDLFYTNNGYSMFSFVLCYLIGAYIRLHSGEFSITNRKAAMICVLCVLFQLGWKLGFEAVTLKLTGLIWNGNHFISYVSPVLIINAAMLLYIFKGIHLSDRFARLCASAASLTFGIYLFHSNPELCEALITGHFNFIGEGSLPWIVIKLLLSAAAVFLVSMAVEFLRSQLFRLLKADRLCRRADRITGWITRKTA